MRFQKYDSLTLVVRFLPRDYGFWILESLLHTGKNAEITPNMFMTGNALCEID